MADLLNNSIGRDIGNENKGASNKKLAELVLEEYKNEGLWVVDKNSGNELYLRREKLSQEQYEKALRVILQKGNDGLNIE